MGSSLGTEGRSGRGFYRWRLPAADHGPWSTGWGCTRTGDTAFEHPFFSFGLGAMPWHANHVGLYDAGGTRNGAAYAVAALAPAENALLLPYYNKF